MRAGKPDFRRKGAIDFSNPCLATPEHKQNACLTNWLPNWGGGLVLLATRVLSTCAELGRELFPNRTVLGHLPKSDIDKSTSLQVLYDQIRTMSHQHATTKNRKTLIQPCKFYPFGGFDVVR